MSKSKNPGVQYPFLTKAQITARLSTDTGFVLTCLQVMHNRQLSFEQEKASTVVKNRAGWMSSHAKLGTTLAKKALAEGLTEEETAQAQALVSRYTRQLADHFRKEEIAAKPELAAVAAVFSAG